MFHRFYQKHGKLGIALIAIGFVTGIMGFLMMTGFPIMTVMTVIGGLLIIAAVYKIVWLGIIVALQGIGLSSFMLIMVLAFAAPAIIVIISILLNIVYISYIVIIIVANKKWRLKLHQKYAKLGIALFAIGSLLGIMGLDNLIIIPISGLLIIVVKIAANEKKHNHFQPLRELSEKVCTICEGKCSGQWNKCPYCGGVLKESHEVSS